MKTLKFETNINCASCVAAVTPALDAAVGAGNWAVDLTRADRELRITAPVEAEVVITAVQSAGYRISAKKFKLFG